MTNLHNFDEVLAVILHPVMEMASRLPRGLRVLTAKERDARPNMLLAVANGIAISNHCTGGYLLVHLPRVDAAFLSIAFANRSTIETTIHCW